MHKEVELKFLDIDPEKTEKLLLNNGFKKDADVKAKSIYFSDEGLGVSIKDLTKKGLRLREFGDKTILTFKGPITKQDNTKSCDEEQIEVDDFESARKLLEQLGFSSSNITVKRQLLFSREDFKANIDFYKGKPPLLEIESDTLENLKNICSELDLDLKKGDDRTGTELFPDLFD